MDALANPGRIIYSDDAQESRGVWVESATLSNLTEWTIILNMRENISEKRNEEFYLQDRLGIFSISIYEKIDKKRFRRQEVFHINLKKIAR